MTEEQAIEILKEIQEGSRAWLRVAKKESSEKIYLRNIEAIETVLNILKDKDREIEKKDKQIDLMTKHMEENMDEYQLDEIYAKQYNCNGMERNWTRGKEKEVTDIKQYFKKLAEEKGETRCI